ncbi:bifunctional proline dehydrogenase/L-glutamate gamma-semialdehyde dehydrogenase PutA [Marivibrio halodurans]|uniref:Bifunctional protein PutA n=2 Tax=Marivibrio halodurans TaxID=2039722 RepID=A0A8J7V1F5_9PROT|nr:bifunctional proline dehydrogenase/L-glutamate gamma-semialdehyde dehydrogenase PutA [Marivibrio halodurans]
MVLRKPLGERSALRAAIDRHYRADETACIESLLGQLDLKDQSRANIDSYARKLVETVRKETAHQGGIDAFLHEYGLSTQEGVLLMCVAEALLRVPDDGTRERLIRDKLGTADWKKHLGHSSSLFVNASTWALMMTGKVVGMHGYKGRSPDAVMRRLVARLGEPVVRESVNQAMRIMGRQFVMGRTIEEALERAESFEKRGYSYSYDMLGEAARTMADAKRYFQSYKQAIEKIGARAGKRGPIAGPGISVKLSALHPRYEVGHYARVMDELVPRLRALCVEAAKHDIGLNIDAEEADRLDISLDCIEAISADPDLKDWSGFGVVVQAYQKRAPHVLDYLADMGRRHGRRFMVRLVKGAYWDMEVKRAQELGLGGYPVFTRKANTDVSYLACARKLFANRDAFYPQLATHNAHSIAAVLEFAGNERDFEFQRLHGMGEELYEQVIEQDGIGAGCRIYAPVGQHEDLLAYLVRRLLENGANSSFVNRMQDMDTPVEEIIADPIRTVAAYRRKPHPRIPMPADIYGHDRTNAKGVDLSDRVVLDRLREEMSEVLGKSWRGGPIIDGAARDGQAEKSVVSPQNHALTIGEVSEATADQVDGALATASKAAREWAARPAEERAACLEKAADLMEAEMSRLMGLCVIEAGKSVMDAVAEIREAIDFCRYYALRARNDLAKGERLRAPDGRGGEVALTGGGVFTCISPWNFPFAIFNGQVTAALVAGNAVIAKPAEQTPLIAAEAVRLLHRAGVPGEVLHLLPGDGERVGGALVKDPRVTGVCFTGSTEVARIINRTLSKRAGEIPPLIAETGGMNAMIVDSTALTEQVSRDVMISAFQSAGQRCSALRVLYVQDDVAERTIDMIAGAMEELTVSDPALVSTDVGPVIDEEAQSMLNSHIKRMLGEANEVKRAKLGGGTDAGSFVTPAAFEIDNINVLQREVFGPILHIVRYKADRLDQVVDAINATGYGLTFGIHTRIDETWKQAFNRARVGNTYVNRNQIGAIVGVQPFGGQGLSGTGPKAGGPHYLHRFVAETNGGGSGAGADWATSPDLAEKVLSGESLKSALAAIEAEGREWGGDVETRADALDEAADMLDRDGGPLKGVDGADKAERARAAHFLRVHAAQVTAEFTEPLALPGPTGERNEMSLWPRGLVACVAGEGPRALSALVAQCGAALAAGNMVLIHHPDGKLAGGVATLFHKAGVPKNKAVAVAPGKDRPLTDLVASGQVNAVAYAGPFERACGINAILADSDGEIRPLILFRESPEEAPGESAAPGLPLVGGPNYLHRFVHERSLSIDTTASGGNASLLSIEDGGGRSLPGEQ